MTGMSCSALFFVFYNIILSYYSVILQFLKWRMQVWFTSARNEVPRNEENRGTRRIEDKGSSMLTTRKRVSVNTCSIRNYLRVNNESLSWSNMKRCIDAWWSSCLVRIHFKHDHWQLYNCYVGIIYLRLFRYLEHRLSTSSCTMILCYKRNGSFRNYFDFMYICILKNTYLFY